MGEGKSRGDCGWEASKETRRECSVLLRSPLYCLQGHTDPLRGPRPLPGKANAG